MTSTSICIYQACCTETLLSEVVTPMLHQPWLHIDNKKNDTIYPYRLSIVIFPEITETPFLLRLKLENSLKINRNNIRNTTANSASCLYIGSVNDRKNSYALINLCHGVHGILLYNNVSYYIKPKSKSNQFLENTSNLSLEWIEKPHVLEVDIKHSAQRKKRNVINKGEIRNTIKFVELYLVNDVSVYNFYKRNATYIEERCKLIAKILDKKFRQIRVRIMLVGVEIWTKKDLMNVSENSQTTLLQFMKYRKNHINNKVRNDNAQFITKKVFDNGKILIYCNIRSLSMSENRK